MLDSTMSRRRCTSRMLPVPIFLLKSLLRLTLSSLFRHPIAFLLRLPILYSRIKSIDDIIHKVRLARVQGIPNVLEIVHHDRGEAEGSRGSASSKSAPHGSQSQSVSKRVDDGLSVACNVTAESVDSVLIVEVGRRENGYHP